MRIYFVVAALLVAAPTSALEPGAPYVVVAQAQSGQPLGEPDVIFVPTPQEVVDDMLQLANVKKDDVLYDLGAGDGRIAVTAAKRYGVRAVGIDIDPERVKEANANAKRSGVAKRVQFRNEDLFKSDFREATVVTLYLLPELNLKLRPRLLAELKPGTRIVSHQFDMGDWKPDRTLKTNGRLIYLWIVPERASRREPSRR